ncbi:hypothetical protein [Lysinibacillus fusiformis]|uniref:hypothetical protein n=1 Tax=Lysinibacillus fusiformis TaxID=28031 RepID=UPI0035C09F67|nr:hypothetical protein QYY55_16100 [Lysinibacillus fusiformis]
MTTMNKQLKRKAVIQQLNKLGIHSIEGQPLEDALYTTLLKTLALKRAAQD